MPGQGVVRSELDIEVTHNASNIAFREPHRKCIQMFIASILLHYIGNLHYKVLKFFILDQNLVVSILFETRS